MPLNRRLFGPARVSFRVILTVISHRLRDKDSFLGFDIPQDSSAGARFEDHAGLCAHVVALTDIGKRRKNNEDNYLVLPLDGKVLRESSEGFTFSLSEPGLLLAVADGMGGHQSGEVASRLCVENVGEELLGRLPEDRIAGRDLDSVFRSAVEATHSLIYNASQGDQALQGMGCTLTAALLYQRRAAIAQVGDSRAYLFREGRLSLLTEDQTVGNLLRSGDESAPLGDRVNDILTQAMGAQEKLNVVMSSARLEPYDSMLICCDGVYKVVSDEETTQILAWETPLRAKAEAFITQANQNGGPDNITVVLAQIRPRTE
ncbi:MAG: PP2C family protein-serine/threonine phosphatase [Terriglobia bacterium]